jgi:hypothetical protein
MEAFPSFLKSFNHVTIVKSGQNKIATISDK